MRLHRRLASASALSKPAEEAASQVGALPAALAALTELRTIREVLVLVGPDGVHALEGWLERLSAYRVTVLASEGSLPDSARQCVVHSVTFARARLVDQLELLRAPDLIVDLAASRTLPAGFDRYQVFLATFLFLRRGGAYVLDRSVDAPDLPLREFGALAEPILTSQAARRPRRYAALPAVDEPAEPLDGAPSNSAEAYALEASVRSTVGSLLVSPNYVIATKAEQHLLRVSSTRAEEVLASREPELRHRVLAALPSGVLDVRATVRLYGDHRFQEPWPGQVEYPEHVVRHYEGQVASLGGMVLVAGETALPDSFRWHLHEHPNNPSLQKAGRVMGLAPRRRPKKRLTGDYYYLDSVFSGHFGHLMSETIAKLWGWEQAKRELPNLKVLFHHRRDKSGRSQIEHALFHAYGIAEDDIVAADRPVWLDSVVGATPQWHNAAPYYAHPDIQRTWGRLTHGLMPSYGPADHDRLFISRGEQFERRRGCHNRVEVERFFEERGFHIVYPELLPLPDQVALFAGARVVAGFGGSAMMNVIHCQRMEATVVLSHSQYDSRNEHLYASVLGGDLHYFLSPSERGSEEWSRAQEAQLAGWSFDFDSLSGDLARVLAAY